MEELWDHFLWWQFLCFLAFLYWDCPCSLIQYLNIDAIEKFSFRVLLAIESITTIVVIPLLIRHLYIESCPVVVLVLCSLCLCWDQSQEKGIEIIMGMMDSANETLHYIVGYGSSQWKNIFQISPLIGCALTKNDSWECSALLSGLQYGKSPC